MKTNHRPISAPRALWLPFLLICGLLLISISCGQAEDKPKSDSASSSGQLVPLDLKLPSPAFKGTPKDMQLGPNVEPLSDKPRPPFTIPPGLKNLAAGAKLTSSDKNATATVLEKITDGDKEPSDQSIIFLRKGVQWVQVDLGAPQEIFAILLWHAHNTPKVYHDIIVQASDDADFGDKAQTLFNNDV